MDFSSGPLASYAYTLDNAGHRTAVAELNGRTVNYGYDNIYRLTSEAVFADPSGNNGTNPGPPMRAGSACNGVGVNYTYDAVGNRTQQTSTNPAITSGGFGYDADDRLTTDTYDANGNTIGSGGLTYSYDFENHLIQQGGATFVYDGDGNRVEKIVGGVTTKYLVSEVNPTGYPQVLTESFSGGTGARELSHTYVYGLDRISQYRSYFTGTQNLTQTSYYVYDGHGSVRALTDPSGNITDTYDYDAFGNLTHSTTTLASPTPNEFLFAGEQYDSNLSLYYNRARYLNVTTGRFWNLDTARPDVWEPESLHKYLYVRADPLDRFDPSGKQDEIDEAGAEAIGETLDSEGTVQGGPVEELASEPEVDVAESAAPAQEGETVQEAEEAQAESPIRQKLKITNERLQHITERHFPGGSRVTPAKSLFNAGEDIRSLVQAGENVNPVQQVGGNLQRVIDAGREIGVDRLTGPTSVYTIITNPAGEVVTAFPGLP